ncbi:CaiB/BaiF CoA transferase family protein [Elioraea sp.]|uniref:CaiB/BaiF CoA transferase family protein n=1 Tax=Elioraea sp. TaxID=2185103 RepID=UPI003F6E518E
MTAPLPLEGIRVVEMTHMVMGPTCGLVLADLGADVIKVEPIEGDNTRRLVGAGAGFFPISNRNKRSIATDLKDGRGRAAILKLVASADVFSENFRPGALDKLGFGWEALSALNPRLIYVSHKGFQDGPYAHRVALDEVVQMMGGLAWMTGPPGQPLRAGASVNDIMGGMFGAIGILAALNERHRTGRGRHIVASLFENTVMLVAQHMAQHAITGEPLKPMSVRVAAWGVYDIIATADSERVFVGVVTDTQWAVFCRDFGFADLAADARIATNTGRVQNRDWLIPELQRRLGAFDAATLSARFEAMGLPFAPIARPEQLFDDPHLNASGGLLPISLPDGRTAKLPALPIAIDGERPGVRRDAPKVGEHGREVLAEAGLAAPEIDALVADGVVRIGEGWR